MTWTLNGTNLGEFRGLSEDKVQSLRHVKTVSGVPCFSSAELPEGTLELWDGPTRVAVITGLRAFSEKERK